jgi:hypothetical protein
MSDGGWQKVETRQEAYQKKKKAQSRRRAALAKEQEQEGVGRAQSQWNPHDESQLPDDLFATAPEARKKTKPARALPSVPDTALKQPNGKKKKKSRRGSRKGKSQRASDAELGSLESVTALLETVLERSQRDFLDMAALCNHFNSYTGASWRKHVKPVHGSIASVVGGCDRFTVVGERVFLATRWRRLHAEEEAERKKKKDKRSKQKRKRLGAGKGEGGAAGLVRGLCMLLRRLLSVCSVLLLLSLVSEDVRLDLVLNDQRAAAEVCVCVYVCPCILFVCELRYRTHFLSIKPQIPLDLADRMELMQAAGRRSADILPAVRHQAAALRGPGTSWARVAQSGGADQELGVIPKRRRQSERRLPGSFDEVL